MCVPPTLGELIDAHAVRRPDALALTFEERETAYAALARIADRIAAALSTASLGTGARVAFLGRNHDRLLALMLGCAKRGCVFTPVNWRLADDEIRYIIDDSDAAMLFHTREHAAFAARAGIPAIDVDGAEWDDWLAIGDADAPTPAVTGDDVVLQIYSSGTTGRPKGVELTHANVLGGGATVLTGAIGGAWDRDDRVLIALPLFHVSALLMATYALVAGAAGVIVRDADPAGIVATARRRRVTKMGFVPTLLQLLIDSPAFDGEAFADFDLIVYGGSTITPALLARAQAAMGCGFLQLYGMSETFTIGTLLSPVDHVAGDPARLASCGRALPGVELRIVDASDADCATGEPGEILIRAVTVMRGYWKLPGETAAVLDDGWYRTGDIGSLDADGYLTIRDRLKDMVISGGENVYPAEVEAALATHPAVAEVAVVGRPHPRWGEAVCAVVVLRGDAPADRDAIVAHARQRIAHYKCPQSVVFVDALPKNAGGKVLKRVLRDTLAV